ncbi:adhesion G protein-coupled receptor E2-like isoform X2 [Stegostoma tigrinum]|uniref:adhesion G protein-coupled receptor E2-like isoform X2 n=1 Tax=Stegostoma tigrinum TaxID=3053191 RepID=UPI00286FE8E7|nr:adhesion G protein-coupled receptor E2-like isoform X2 [Stegostoma tigrinum]
MQREATTKSRYLSVILVMYCSHHWNHFSITVQTSLDQSEPCNVSVAVGPEDHFEPSEQNNGNNSIQDPDILESIVEDIIARGIFASDQLKNESKMLRRAMEIAGLNTCAKLCSYRLSTTYFELEVQVIRFNADQNIRTATLSAHQNLVEIPLEMENSQQDLVALAFLSYNSTNLNDIHLDMKNLKKPGITVISDVVTAIKRAKNLRKPSEPIHFIFQNDQTVNGFVECVYLKSGMDNSTASFEECDTENFNETHVVCKCKLVSDFAVLAKHQNIMSCQSSSILTDIGIFVIVACVAITLFATAICSEKKPVIFLCLLLVELSALASFDVFGHVVGYRNHFEDTKSIITITCLIISEVSLVVMIFIFTHCSLAKTHVSNSHIHLCLNLFLANMLFITQSDRICNKTVCAITAVWLHYLYLTVFAWMFMEGLQLYLMSINLRNMRVSSSTTMQKFKIPFCYLSPIVIVVISAATHPSAYVSHTNCFLQKENIWYFSGPVLLIILVNIILFSRTLWILTEQISKRNTEISKIKDSRMLTFKILLQLVILGCPWIIGFFDDEDPSGIMEYIFIIIIPLQGFLIFLILCVFSAEVREECKKWFLGVIQKHNISNSTLYTGTT